MVYNFEGKNYNIKDAEIQNYMDTLALTEEQAIELWLDDHDVTECEKAAELTAKAKANKADKVVGSGKQRKPRAKVEKVDEDKEYLIKLLFDALGEQIDNKIIKNKSKIVEFDYNGSHYKLDLIKQRKKND